jgi:hypothetical protein
MLDVEVFINYNSEELPPPDFMWCLNGKKIFILLCFLQCTAEYIVETSVCLDSLVRPAI